MADSLTTICRSYYNEALSACSPDQYFFPARDGGYISNQNIGAFLKKALKDHDLYLSARVHDLRHTFAVHTLNRWSREGRDLNVLLPILSTYLGHATIRATANYLRLTAEMYPDITRITSQQYGHLIPEVVSE